jgi:hypothetical protein
LTKKPLARAVIPYGARDICTPEPHDLAICTPEQFKNLLGSAWANQAQSIWDALKSFPEPKIEALRRFAHYSYHPHFTLAINPWHYITDLPDSTIPSLLKSTRDAVSAVSYLADLLKPIHDLLSSSKLIGNEETSFLLADLRKLFMMDLRAIIVVPHPREIEDAEIWYELAKVTLAETVLAAKAAFFRLNRFGFLKNEPPEPARCEPARP